MKRLLQCSIGALSSSLSALSRHPLTPPRRHCATTPTEDDVRRAYKTLGVHATATLADVKKRYGALAKEHHPDVATSATSSTDRMTDINTAYTTVKQFYQAGGRLSSRPSPASSSTSSDARSSSEYYTKYDAAYQPWHEDMDPLMYELMWEEMRRQNEEEAFNKTAHAENFNRMNGQWRQPRHNFANGRSAKPRPSSPGHSGGDRAGSPNASQPSKNAANTTTWPEEQVKAMVNMYQDGKSFEFIANALGKENAGVVMEEFNRWSADSQSNRRRNNNSSNNRQGNNGRRRRPSNRPHDFYFAESPDDIPFELYEMMEEEPYCDGSGADMGNPFGYYPGDDDTYFGNATPFYGTHQMSGGGPIYNSSRSASYKPQRHHRGGAPHRGRRRNNDSSSGGNRADNNSNRT
ncbi:hypothetical protein ABB37_07045 [Leptomonas pyrrhocoris]|uniref:J domain-containing protein n=1 Tax=Leptomonas pyrrhocoris TaxID=157538 RepID=A0A0N0VEF9_LEPPY|nr:hypothetical protein ABB37_07045 [Leptomonas pyrrhocoris]KPA77724.1 hypothetical protein ABB37_07045 [Leptomonas pyrrhocoris]|eukprot:XP_015656163.1 hypothetical protein ABB37_07045 [Leptomonas pyrrhocoris]